MTTLSSLGRALAAVESAMPPLWTALVNAKPEIRAAYRQHRQDVVAWCAARDGQPGAAYEALLDDEAPPPVPDPLRRSILPPPPLICVGDNAGEIYRDYLKEMT